MAPIAVTLERQDPTAGIITLTGENDAYAAPRLENELSVLIESGMSVVIDLTDATFVDSQVLSVLLSSLRDATAAALGYALVLPDTSYTQVHRLLEMTGLRASFPVHATATQALAAVRKTSGDRARAA